MKYALPNLPYAYDALEPFFDARTMEIHHTKHHQTYIDKLNAALEPHPDLQTIAVGDLLLKLDTLTVDDKTKTAIRNHGGGHVNHSLFWTLLGAQKEIDEQLVNGITKTFGSVENFKKEFTGLALNLFGSGWVWLARDEKGTLHMHQMPNQDSPLLHGHSPVLGLDVWEHAYYLKYQNRRADYIDAWWSVLKLLP